MKKNSLLFLVLMLGIGLFAQKNSGKGFSYQAVARDANGEVMSKKPVEIRFSLYPGHFAQSASWIETHQDTTDSFGTFALIIGEGFKTGGTANSFTDVNFGDAEFWLKVEIKDGNDYTEYSFSKLLSVPYAEYAGNACNIPVGSIMPFAGPKENVPEGWFLCDGKELNKQDYPLLFKAIGTAWGSNNSNTFNIPDLQGLFLRGVANGSNNDPDREARIPLKTGGNINDNVGSMQICATKLPNNDFKTDDSGNHNHSNGKYDRLLSWNGRQTGDEVDDTDSEFQEPNIRCSGSILPAGNHNHIIVSGGDNETRPINAYVNYIIKY